MTKQVNTPSLEMKTIGTKSQPVHSIESGQSFIGAKVFNTDDVEKIRIEGQGMFPLLKIMQGYGVNKVAYIGGRYVIGDTDDFMTSLLMMISELGKNYGDELSILLHIDIDDIDTLHNALVFADFNVDGSLSNGAKNLAAYTLNL